jgi:hypothetical protein
MTLRRSPFLSNNEKIVLPKNKPNNFNGAISQSGFVQVCSSILESLNPIMLDPHKETERTFI